MLNVVSLFYDGIGCRPTIYHDRQIGADNAIAQQPAERISGRFCVHPFYEVTFVGILTRRIPNKNEMKHHKSCEERKVIVIFFSFIITLSTAHFSNILHFLSDLIAWKESKITFMGDSSSSRPARMLINFIYLFSLFPKTKQL